MNKYAVLNCCLILIAILCQSNINAEVFENKIFKKGINGVKLYPSNNEIGIPVITLNGTETLVFTFDDLGTQSKYYQYTILQCNQDWTPSIQNQFMYLDGYTQINISDYAFSANTVYPYTNYRFTIPNQDVSIKQSGNYILKVFEDNPDEPILTWRFMVAEPIVEVNAFVSIPRTSFDQNRFQEVVFKVNHSGLIISNPFQEIRASVLQNQRWDNAATGILPRFIRPNEMNFDSNGQIIFESGREYRRFDIRSLRFNGDGIRAIDRFGGENNTYLLLDALRSRQKYFIENDINGQFYFDVREFRNRRFEADYTYVHFAIPMDYPLSNGDIYFGGTWNEFSTSETNKMLYNPETKMYEGMAFLKQGYYNYCYYFMEKGSKIKDFSLTEGNFFDTENDYMILIYYRPFGENYDRLIGFTKINSMLNRF